MPRIETSTTSWTLIDAASAGDREAQSRFVSNYLPAVRAYLEARWGPRRGAVEDAVQDVFWDCLREDGALGRTQPSTSRSFRAFLYGVTRKVAARHEERQRRERARIDSSTPTHGLLAREEALSRAFDRAWAHALLDAAAQRMAAEAAAQGEEAERRVAILRLRFADGLPIREIARRWETSSARLHREYARARLEFRHALLVELGRAEDCKTAEAECAQLLDIVRRHEA